MKLNLTDEDVQTLLNSLVKAHRDALDKADSWSFALEDHFEKYLELRTKELELAKTINRINQQLANQPGNTDPNTAEEPLADWEKELLAGSNGVGD